MCGRRDARGRAAHLTALLIALAGCAVGPDFVRPAPPGAPGYTAGTLPAATAPADERAQRFMWPAPVATDWWRLFRSADLDARIGRALAANPTLAAARASLRRSEDDLRAGYAVFLPQIDASTSAIRQKPFLDISGVPRHTFDLYTLAGTVDYVLDVFGGERRAVESQRAQVETQEYETAAAYLTLTGNVVNATINEAAYAAQLDAIRGLAAIEADQVAIVRAQADAGTVPYSSVLLLETQRAATDAQVPALEQRLAETRHLLATLLGEEPGTFTAAPVALTSLELPADVPVTLPSEMARQRPDVLAAEASLHQASAEVGVATAAMFPHITLTAVYGWDGTTTAALISGPNAAWQLGAQLATPVFHGGALWFQRKAAIDVYTRSLATYRQTVLAALAQVADVLRALEHDAVEVAAQARQEAAASEALRLTAVNYESGTVNYLDVLTANIQENQAIIARVGGRAQRLQDTAALFVALGGGWWDAKDEIVGRD